MWSWEQGAEGDGIAGSITCLSKGVKEAEVKAEVKVTRKGQEVELKSTTGTGSGPATLFYNLRVSEELTWQLLFFLFF